MVLRSAHEPNALEIPGIQHLYLGDPDAPEPFAGLRALVAAAPEHAAEETGERVVVGGSAATYLPSSGPGEAAIVRFVRGGLSITVSSTMHDRSGLLALAAAVRVRDGQVGLDGPVAGVAVVEDAGRASAFLTGDLGVRSVGYSDDDGRVVVVATVPGDASRLRALEWWGGTRTTVAGRPAVVLRGGDADSPTRVALWRDGDLVVEVSGNLDDAGLDAVAAGLREVDAATWAATVAPVQAGR